MAFDAEQKAPREQGYQIYPMWPITPKHAGLHKTRQEPLARHLAFPPALGQKWILAPSLLGQLDVIVRTVIQVQDKEGAMNFNALVPSHSHLHP